MLQVALGTVTASPAASKLPGGTLAARMVKGVLVPSGMPFEARLVNLGQGAGKGGFVPVAKGDEVLVLFPEGRTTSAVAIGGLGSVINPNPAANTGDKILQMHPGGVELRTTDGPLAERIVLAPLLSALLTWFQAFAVFMNATKADTFFSPTVGPAAIAMGAATGEMTQLIADLTASVAAGPPFAAMKHKATAT